MCKVIPGCFWDKGWSRQPLLTAALQQCWMPLGWLCPSLGAARYPLSFLHYPVLQWVPPSCNCNRSTWLRCCVLAEALVRLWWQRIEERSLLAEEVVQWMGLSSGPAWTGKFPLHTVLERFIDISDCDSTCMGEHLLTAHHLSQHLWFLEVNDGTAVECAQHSLSSSIFLWLKESSCAAFDPWALLLLPAL